MRPGIDAALALLADRRSPVNTAQRDESAARAARTELGPFLVGLVLGVEVRGTTLDRGARKEVPLSAIDPHPAAAPPAAVQTLPPAPPTSPVSSGADRVYTGPPK